MSTGPSNVYVWTSLLTDPDYLDQWDSRFTVELWSNGRFESDSVDYKTIKAVAEGGFKMVFSNYEQTYIDAGYGGWNYERTMQKVYEDNPWKILERHEVSNMEEAQANALGGEIAMWTELTDDASLMATLEPRTAAYAETMWRDPRENNEWADAAPRMIRHSDRLRERGIGADALTQR